MPRFYVDFALSPDSEMFPILLNYLGKDPKGSNPEDLKAAAEVLKKKFWLVS